MITMTTMPGYASYRRQNTARSTPIGTRPAFSAPKWATTPTFGNEATPGSLSADAVAPRTAGSDSPLTAPIPTSANVMPNAPLAAAMPAETAPVPVANAAFDTPNGQVAPALGNLQRGQTAGIAESDPNTPVIWTKAEQDLQRQFPGTYAQLVDPLPLAKALPTGRNTMHALYKWYHHMPLKDYELSSLDDTTKRLGSLAIATIATFGLKNRILGVPEFLGLASWLTAMSATPRIINGMVQLKTGVNLEQNYRTSNGDIKNLFLDPHYQPLQILTNEMIDKAGEKLGIPLNAPERRKKIEEKMRQISVQANTLWMLVAGPATPVLSGLACDLLQDPAWQAINQMKKRLTLNGINNFVKFSHQSAEEAETQLLNQFEKHLNTITGETVDSSLSLWWKKLDRGLVKQTGAGSAFAPWNPFRRPDFIEQPKETVYEKLVEHFEKFGLGDSKPDILEKQKLALKSLPGTVERQTREALGAFYRAQGRNKMTLSPNGKSRLKALEESTSLRIENANKTLRHYEALYEATRLPSGTPAEQQARRNAIQAAMEQNLPTLQSLERQGQRAEAEKLAGVVRHGNDEILKQETKDYFKTIQHSLANLNNKHAFELMGAAPRDHLLKAMRDSALRKCWQNRMLWGVGGSLLGLTALYTTFIVGRDFKPASLPKKPEALPAEGAGGVAS